MSASSGTSFYNPSHVVDDRVRELTLSTGDSGKYVLAGPPPGYRPFIFGPTEVCTYLVEDDEGKWEIGAGHRVLDDGDPYIQRDYVIASFTAPPYYYDSTPVDWGAGTKTISIVKTATPLDLQDVADRVAGLTCRFEQETEDATPTVMALGYGTVAIKARNQVHILVRAAGDEEDEGSDAKAWEIKALFHRGSVVGTMTKTVIAETAGASAWDVSLAVVDSEYQITVTGGASTWVYWAATVITNEWRGPECT